MRQGAGGKCICGPVGEHFVSQNIPRSDLMRFFGQEVF